MNAGLIRLSLLGVVNNGKRAEIHEVSIRAKLILGREGF
jgi:hypothetical protein